MNKKIRYIFLALVLSFTTALCFAEKTPVENLYEYKLDNGLELFVMENHAAPLAYIEIAVKAGGRAQTKENAGLFHLYEHMMFKGNTKYPDAASVQRAINDMGVANWNGSTDLEHVNYYFTVPSDLLYKGLEFWSYAVREPLLKPDELENEKKVVLSEVEGSIADSNRILNDATNKLLFPDAPWRLDPSGAGDIVRNATVSDLKKIQETYYIPNNAALFVGGDVSADDVYKKVQALYGGWKKGADPWAKQNVQQAVAPFTNVELRVMPFDKCSPQIAQISIQFRGPDTAFDKQATYAADVLGYLFQNPDGLYKKTLLANTNLGIPDPDYTWEGYVTRRESGVIDFGAVVLSPEQFLPQRAKFLLNVIQQDVVQKIISDKTIFSDEEFKNVKQSVSDDRIIEAETASGFLRSLRFWWIADSAEYYFKYNENMSKVGWEQIASFLNTYVAGKKPLITVLVNPEVYKKTKASFEAEGFKEITADDAFWWKTGAPSAGESAASEATDSAKESN
jgi:zinc protease